MFVSQNKIYFCISTFYLEYNIIHIFQVQDVQDHVLEDRMESFFLAETTKYLYLLFDTENFIHNAGKTSRTIHTPSGQCIANAGGYIFNTEAHPIDPALLYCCSRQRQNHLKILRDFEDNMDLASLLG